MAEKILVVDDEEPVREVLRNLLEMRAYAVILASDGEEAIRLAESEKPQLIILDAAMPKIDGLETCRRLRSEEKTRPVPIILMTGFGEVIAGALAAGADDFVTKPFSLTELLIRVEAMLKVRFLEDRVERAMAYIQEIRKGSSSTH